MIEPDPVYEPEPEFSPPSTLEDEAMSKTKPEADFSRSIVEVEGPAKITWEIAKKVAGEHLPPWELVCYSYLYLRRHESRVMGIKMGHFQITGKVPFGKTEHVIAHFKICDCPLAMAMFKACVPEPTIITDKETTTHDDQKTKGQYLLFA